MEVGVVLFDRVVKLCRFHDLLIVVGVLAADGGAEPHDTLLHIDRTLECAVMRLPHYEIVPNFYKVLLTFKRPE